MCKLYFCLHTIECGQNVHLIISSVWTLQVWYFLLYALIGTSILDLFLSNELQIPKDTKIRDNVVFGQQKICAVLVGNMFLLFGGHFEARQILIIYPWGVERIQTLPFDFDEGKCHYHENTVYLCFYGRYNARSCYKRYRVIPGVNVRFYNIL